MITASEANKLANHDIYAIRDKIIGEIEAKIKQKASEGVFRIVYNTDTAEKVYKQVCDYFKNYGFKVSYYKELGTFEIDWRKT
jgi:uncharacterized lipoprotein